MPQRAILNLAPNHTFAGWAELPEAQILLLVPRAIWSRTRIYVRHFEAVKLAGRFGADPGDYEWELIDQPHGIKWWRRTTMGDAAYCAAIVAPQPDTDPIEVFGLIDIASDSPWWFDAVEDIEQMQVRAELTTRQRQISIDEARLIVSVEEEYRPREMVSAETDEKGVAWRTGNMKEALGLKDALIGLFSRARVATLPDEVNG